MQSVVQSVLQSAVKSLFILTTSRNSYEKMQVAPIILNLFRMRVVQMFLSKDDFATRISKVLSDAIV